MLLADWADDFLFFMDDPCFPLESERADFSDNIFLYGDEVNTAADSPMRVRGRGDFSFGRGESSARIALAFSRPGCGSQAAASETETVSAIPLLSAKAHPTHNQMDNN